uniref:Regulator of G-protein signaling 1 n=1 Tax=Pygocentrus nattereri TaxID=42514 RepID=A0AAR2K4D3_PYGNA
MFFGLFKSRFHYYNNPLERPHKGLCLNGFPSECGIFSFVAGQLAFQEFLRSEYSEENILFWLACEDYKKIKNTSEMIITANRIYSEFVQVEAPRQINIDCGTRANITKNISEPNLNSFDTAQKLIFSLMARDCYPRFLKSEIYQSILRKVKSSTKA